MKTGDCRAFLSPFFGPLVGNCKGGSRPPFLKQDADALHRLCRRPVGRGEATAEAVLEAPAPAATEVEGALFSSVGEGQ
jgi:hypothetical protein